MAEATAHAVAADRDLSQIVSFLVGRELFGIGIDRVKEIVRYPEITSVPRAPEYLTGLANLRGSVLPVIDARIRLNLPVTEITDSSRVLVIDTGATLTGVIVDAVRGVINMEEASVEPPPSIISSGVDTRYISSVLKMDNGDKIVMELDIDRLCVIDARGSRTNERPADREQAVRQSAQAGIDEIQLVTFLVAHEEYGLPIESVREVLRVGRVTEVPEAPSYVLGIFSVRNTLLPIVDIRRLFAIPSLIDDMGDELERMKETHRLWLDSLRQSLASGMGFTGETDPSRCDLGRFLEGFRTSSEEIGRAIQDIRFIHQGFHELAPELQEARRSGSADETLRRFDSEAVPMASQLGSKMDGMKLAVRDSIKEDQRILVVDIGAMPIGILVDRMRQVIRVPENIIDPPPSILSSDKSESLRGIVKLEGGKRLILLLDENRVITGERSRELKELHKEAAMENETAAPAGNGSGDEVQLVTFRLGREEFALGIDDVQEINRLENITAVPRAPSFVEGVMNLRGNVIPAIDLRKRFGMETVTHDEQTRVIIVTMAGKLTGFVVDSVSEVLRLSRKAIEQPPDVIFGNVDTEFIKGVGTFDGNARMILLIDIGRILTSDEQKQLDFGGGTVAAPEAPVKAGEAEEAETAGGPGEQGTDEPPKGPRGLKKAR